MATTALSIIKRALRLARVIDAHTPMDANDAADALETLNAVLAEWHEADIGLPDYKLETLETELASDAADREAIAYELALRLAPEYGASLSAETAAAGMASQTRMRLRYFQPGCSDFSELPRQRVHYNIELG